MQEEEQIREKERERQREQGRAQPHLRAPSRPGWGLRWAYGLSGLWARPWHASARAIGMKRSGSRRNADDRFPRCSKRGRALDVDRMEQMQEQEWERGRERQGEREQEWEQWRWSSLYPQGRWRPPDEGRVGPLIELGWHRQEFAQTAVDAE